MKILNTLRAALRGGTTGFNSMEQKILHALMAQIDAGAAEKLRRRIDQIDLVQRHDGGREVNCYKMVNGKAVFDESTRLANADGEQAFARFSFTACVFRRCRPNIPRDAGHRFRRMAAGVRQDDVTLVDEGWRRQRRRGRMTRSVFACAWMRL